ncbi:sensor of ECF-type sigma factor [Flavobacterium sp. K5-23]|uniref:sensor of ECF-type sigma factor n=1 Tax=Flavobacterium sp. K5-23 TaxID=2746225 RepID=UPI00200D8709|nr:sensor of ECF-type sigma factor [Flavobacterium sp. K5-23]UQD56552.1 sensor of ECF-type sigma factor [Flavobacterium sp. K5-23]
MNIKTLLPILLFFVSFTFFGQVERMKEKKEQIKALKVAFFTTELDLTSNEAERFWPIYNTYDDKQFEIRHKKMKAFVHKMDDNALDKMSEKEASTLLSLLSSSEEDLFLLRKKLNNDLKEILPSVKIIKLKKAEDNFNRKLLHQYRDKHK